MRLPRRAQLHELEGHLSDLATTRQVIISLSHGEPALPEAPDLPGNPAYQNILAALTESPEPVRAKALRQRLDFGQELKNIEGMRPKLKRLVSRGAGHRERTGPVRLEPEMITPSPPDQQA